MLVDSLLTGSNRDTKENFDRTVHLFINFQISKSKNHLVKMVRDAKKARRSAKYRVNQNGRVTVKVYHNPNSWSEVTSFSFIFILPPKQILSKNQFKLI